MQDTVVLENELISAWVRLSSIVKNNRMTKDLKYNEAIIMLSVYKRYVVDGVGLTSVKDIINETGMLKSLVNRTLGELKKKGLINFVAGEKDRRTKFVVCVTEKLDTFLAVHNNSRSAANNIIEIIGKDDAEAFVRIADKLSNAHYKAY